MQRRRDVVKAAPSWKGSGCLGTGKTVKRTRALVTSIVTRDACPKLKFALRVQRTSTIEKVLAFIVTRDPWKCTWWKSRRLRIMLDFFRSPTVRACSEWTISVHLQKKKQTEKTAMYTNTLLLRITRWGERRIMSIIYILWPAPYAEGTEFAELLRKYTG